MTVDQASGKIYLAWAKQTFTARKKTNEAKKDQRLEAAIARSEDGGKNFSAPAVVSSKNDRVESYTVAPVQVVAGPKKDQVFILYSHKDPNIEIPAYSWGRNVLRFTRSNNGGQSFTDPVEVGNEPENGVINGVGMHYLFAATNGHLYISWIDFREDFVYRFSKKKEPSREEAPPYQLRVSRSIDGGNSFEKSVLVTKPICACCGTEIAQSKSGLLFASTRSKWNELKGSYDDVRDIFICISKDQGNHWSKPVKIYDDRFKISACPDITMGLSVDSRNRLHIAWYTGTDRHPGIFYAYSDDEGKSFSKPLSLLSDDWVPYGDVKLAVDAGNNAWVVFEDRRGEVDMIQVACISSDNRIRLSSPWPGTSPDIAATSEGAVVVWGTLDKQSDEQNGGIHLRTVKVN